MRDIFSQIEPELSTEGATTGQQYSQFSNDSQGTNSQSSTVEEPSKKEIFVDLMEKTPWTYWEDTLENNSEFPKYFYKDVLKRVGVGAPVQNMQEVNNKLQNLMNDKEGAIYMKIYNFNKVWKMQKDEPYSTGNITDDLRRAANDEKENDKQERNEGTSENPIDFTNDDSEDDSDALESQQEADNSQIDQEKDKIIQIIEESKKNNISENLNEHLTFYYTSILKIANLFYGKQRNKKKSSDVDNNGNSSGSSSSTNTPERPAKSNTTTTTTTTTTNNNNNNTVEYDYTFMKVPVIWKGIMTHLKKLWTESPSNPRNETFEDIIEKHKSDSVEDFMSALVAPWIRRDYSWRMYLLIFLVTCRIKKDKVGMVTKNLHSRFSTYVQNEESFAFAYGLRIETRKSSTERFQKGHLDTYDNKNNKGYWALTDKERKKIMERIENECHRIFARFGRMECNNLEYFGLKDNKKWIWPTKDTTSDELELRKKGIYPNIKQYKKTNRNVKWRKETRKTTFGFKYEDLLEQCDNVEDIDDRFWSGMNYKNTKGGKEYIYGNDDSRWLLKLHLSLMKVFEHLKSGGKAGRPKIFKERINGNHTIEFRVTGFEYVNLYDLKEYENRWTNKEIGRPLIWDMLKTIIHGAEKVQRGKKRNGNKDILDGILKGANGGNKKLRTAYENIIEDLKDLNLKF